MEKKITETLEELGVKDIEAAVQDNGALDIVPVSYTHLRGIAGSRRPGEGDGERFAARP